MREFPEKRTIRRAFFEAMYYTVFSNFSLRSVPREDGGILAVFSLFDGFGSFSLVQFVTLAGTFLLFAYEAYVRNNEKRKRIYLIPAVFYAFFMVEGRGFAVYNGIEFFSKGLFNKAESFIVFTAYLILFYAAFNLIDYMLEKMIDQMAVQNADSKLKRFVSAVNKRPFIFVFSFLIICYLPYFISSFPAILSGDTIEQVQQGFAVSSYHPYVVRTYEDSVLVNHHPVMHTLFIKLCMKIGQMWFLNWNAGIFIYALVQSIISISIYSYAISVLYNKTSLKDKYKVFIMLYFAIHPRIQAYLMVVTKDILYSAFLLLLIILTYELMIGDGTPLKLIGIGLSLVCTIIFRNEGIYIAVPFLLISCIRKKYRKTAAFLAMFSLLFWVGWNHVVLPVMHVNDGSVREMLSIPFQQTARYVKEYHREVTDEEREAISKVLRYHTLARDYDPDISDYIKGTYNEKATQEDLKEYFRVWLQMGIKHPEVYFAATIDNKSQLFCPDLALGNYYSYESSQSFMELVNDTCTELKMDLGYPEKLTLFRQVYEKIREGIFSMPIIAALRCSFLYVWITLFWAFYCLKKKSLEAFTFTVPLLMLILVLIAGPTNGYYFRYMTPFIITLPFVVLFGFEFIHSINPLSEKLDGLTE